MSTWSMLVTASASLVVSAAVLEMVWRWARLRLLDVPNARSSHTTPTPRGGGIAVIAALLLVTPISVASIEAARAAPALLVAYTVAFMGIASISWIDDRTPLPAKLRLYVHAAMALLLVAVSVSAFATPALPWRLAFAPLLLVWLVGVTNAFNFMDGIDGIAGAQAAVAGAVWSYIGFHWSAPITGTIGLVLAAATVAFLRRNWSPATIFMGDVGSASLGFLLAGIPVLFAWEVPAEATRVFAIPIGVLVLWPFLFDATFTMLQRFRRGERLTEAHRSHLYQRLVIAGTSHAAASTLYAGFAITGGAVAIVCAHDARAGLFVLPAIPMQALWLVRFARARERLTRA